MGRGGAASDGATSDRQRAERGSGRRGAGERGAEIGASADGCGDLAGAAQGQARRLAAGVTVEPSSPSASAMLSLMTAARKHELEPEVAPAEETGEMAYGEEWEAEIERRAEEYRAGRVQGIPWEQVRAEIKAEFGWD